MADQPDVPEVAEQDSSPEEQPEVEALVSEDDKPPSKGFADHPRFQELVVQKNTANDKATEAEAELVKVRAELANLQPKPAGVFTPASSMSDDNRQILEEIYMPLRDQIFKEADEVERKRLAEQTAQQQAEGTRLKQAEDEVTQEINEIKSELGSEEAIRKFGEFADSFAKRFPSVSSVKSIFEEYKARGEFTPKASSVATGSGGGRAEPTREIIDYGKDLTTVVHEKAKDLGMEGFN